MSEIRIITISTCALILSLFAPIVPAAADDTMPPIEASVREVVNYLSEIGLSFDLKAAEKAAALALIQEADPGGRLLKEADEIRLNEMHKGISYSIMLDLIDTNEYPEISGIEEGSTAEETGLLVGDRIESVNSESVKGYRAAQILELFRGPRDETVHVSVLGTNDVQREFEVKRSLVQLETVETSDVLPMNICYMKVNGLFEGSGTDIIRQLRKWAQEGYFGVIIDLRDAGGTDIQSVVEVASLFSPAGSFLFSFRGAENEDLETYKSETTILIGMPCMILMNGETSGAPEILAAVLSKSVSGAMLIGERSAADPLIRDRVTLSSGDVIYVATKRFVTSDGSIFDGKEGVVPDVEVEPGRASRSIKPSRLAPDKDISEDAKEQQKLRTRTRGDAALGRAADILIGLRALDFRGTQYQSTDPAS